MSGTGKLEHDEESGDGGRNLRRDLGVPGHRLSVSDVQQTQTVEHKNKAAARDGISSKIATRIESALKLVQHTRPGATGGRTQVRRMSGGRPPMFRSLSPRGESHGGSPLSR